MDTDKTIVVFRKFKNEPQKGEVIALFPEIPFSHLSTYQSCVSYMHTGQHGAASYTGVIENSKPATPADYEDLKNELEDIGYNLSIKKKYTFKRR